ncbi:hypothetical protein [Capnocytophaga sp. oral taxon 326]|uniref:hypothetical protein n=1 Tax=Capnocytophaga sp. oral taxon 326 TaxID=712212 RepID=UPI0002A39206|nr:hypothetical protein [Capnocytophaga sp. oral taxon 326]EKY11928.1 hypothetical protein HMPREF9073_02886 [Capnocytophaga sp. oral taxon 326 str. F0382]
MENIIIIAIALLVLFWFIKKKTKKRKSKKISIEEIRKYWREKRIPADDCEVKEVPAFFDWKALDDTSFDSNFGKAKIVYRAMAAKAVLTEDEAKENMILTRLRCFDKSTTPIEVYEINFVNIDLDILQAKLNVQGYVNIYFNPQSYQLHIDAEFLEKDLSELMNH